MNILALFFICMRMFHFIHTQRIYFFLQGFAKLLEEKRKHPERKQVILVDGSVSIFIMYFVSDVLFNDSVGYFIHNVPGHFGFTLQRKGLFTIGVDQRDFVGVAAETGTCVGQ